MSGHAPAGQVYLWLSADLTNQLFDQGDARKLMQYGMRIYLNQDGEEIYTLAYTKGIEKGRPLWRDPESMAAKQSWALVGILKSRIVIQTGEQWAAYKMIMEKITNPEGLPKAKDYQGVPTLAPKKPEFFG